MRQIEQMVQFVARIVFHKDYLAYEIVYADTDTSGPDSLFLELSLLLKKKNFVRQRTFCLNGSTIRTSGTLRWRLTFIRV